MNKGIYYLLIPQVAIQFIVQPVQEHITLVKKQEHVDWGSSHGAATLLQVGNSHNW